MKTNLLLKTTMVVSLLAVCGVAFALTATMNFSGSVAEVFTLAPISGSGSGGSTGVMALATGSITRLSSTSTEGSGSPVSYSIASNASVTSLTVSVANPVPIGAAAQAAFAGNTQYGAEIHQNGNLIAAASKGGSSSSSSMPLGNFDVSVWIDNGTAPLPSGDYTVSVTTTLLPN